MALGETELDSTGKRVLHLHVQDREINHPAVYITWCLDRDFAADRHAKGNRKSLVLLIQMILEKEDGTRREERIFVPDVMNVPGRFLPFAAPGEWQVNAYVVELQHEGRGKNSVFRVLRDGFLQRSGDGYYHSLAVYHYTSDKVDFWRTNQQILRMVCHNNNVKYQGLGELEIVMPKDAFAPPPPKWLDAWVRAYTPRSKPIDECDFRRRAILSFFIQPIPYLLWESTKRFFTAIVGILMVIFSGYVKKGNVVFRRAFSPQLVFAFPAEESKVEETSVYRSWPSLLRPFRLVSYGLAAWLLWSLREPLTYVGGKLWELLSYIANVLFAHSSVVVTILTGIGIIVALVIATFFVRRALIAHLERTRSQRFAARAKREAEREKAEAEVRERRKTLREAEAEAIRTGKTELLAVCGPDGQPAARGTAILRKSIRLQVSALKRKVCREYA